ncbi:MAG TPA: hypothetical protein VGF75_00010, partial [Candidatus Saccharimonadales bacterium]
MNQILQQILRYYINDKKDNWIQLLLTVQLTINTAVTGITGITPFNTNYGFTLTIYEEPRDNS